MKKRPTSHVTDSTGVQLLKNVLPREWVVRDYQPDYGIDFTVEVFDAYNDGYVTLGEHFFVQLKSHADVKWITKKVSARYNIEKSSLNYNLEESSRIRVIAECIETAELQLARSMGPAAPLALVVADTTRSEVYWVCLNDFVDKVLVPEVGLEALSAQDSHTVHIPDFNRIERTDSSLIPLKFLARRAKLYAAFNRFRYQRHEVNRAIVEYGISMEEQLQNPAFLHMAHHFFGAILAYDFWKTTHAWPAIELTHRHAEATASTLAKVMAGVSLESALGPRLNKVSLPEASKTQMLMHLFASDIQSTFDRLANLGNMFEEICREWLLPTHLGMLAEQHQLR